MRSSLQHQYINLQPRQNPLLQPPSPRYPRPCLCRWQMSVHIALRNSRAWLTTSRVLGHLRRYSSSHRTEGGGGGCGGSGGHVH